MNTRVVGKAVGDGGTGHQAQPVRSGRTITVSTPKKEAKQVEQGNEEAVKQAIASFYIANKAANTLGREVDRKKKALHKLMLDGEFKKVTAVVEDGENRVPVEATISAEMGSMISVYKLREFVDEESFMKIISATKTKVTAIAGTNVCIASTVDVLGKEDLHVREVK